MFEHLDLFPTDPILGLIAAFAEDDNPDKVDLGVGVYKDENGDTPIPAAVKQAERIRLETETTKTYFTQVGNPLFNSEVQRYLLGADSATGAANRVRTLQTPGGSGAISLAGKLLGLARPGTKIWLSDPTWDNHGPLLSSPDVKLVHYPYYDRQQHEIRFSAMMEQLDQLGSGDSVLLHGCCHNPCGADLSLEQWQMLADVLTKRQILPFIDIAYHGLAKGTDTDVAGLRLLAERVPEMLISYSCSKNFGLYRERVGAIINIGRNPQEADRAFSQILGIARRVYSAPPSHGQAIVGTILSSAELKASWEAELKQMRDRLNHIRATLSDALNARQEKQDFGFIKEQYGMFSFLGLSVEQIKRLREQYSVYMVENSRVNIAGVNANNVDYLADAITAVISE